MPQSDFPTQRLGIGTRQIFLMGLVLSLAGYLVGFMASITKCQNHAELITTTKKSPNIIYLAKLPPCLEILL